MSVVTKKLERASENETLATLSVLDEIIELERTEKYKEYGYTGMYPILTKKLNYSEGAAMRRLHAARVIAKFPKAS